MKKEKDENLIAQNKKARHDYFIKETYEAGIALTGTEIKSVRARRINLRDGTCRLLMARLFWRTCILVNISKAIDIITNHLEVGDFFYTKRRLID
mgnify:CR=1 FL=1